MSIKDRLREAIEAQNTSIKAFSESIDIPLRTLHNYLSGEREPSSEFLVKFAEKTKINLNWLLLNDGEIYLNKAIDSSLNKDELDLLNQYRLMNHSGKNILKSTSQIIFDELK